jgi:NTP pyrophosphatase (non-canonical NTP hydrolase)
MTFNEYQAAALRTAKDRKDFFARLQEGALGLCGEAGEVAELIKKGIYQGHVLNRHRIREELGDAMWYISLIAAAAGIELDEVAKANIEKLRNRYPDGFDSERSIHREGTGE